MMPAGLKMQFFSDLDLLLGGPALRLPTLGLAVTLLALAILDLKYFWLPDAVTLPLLVGGG
jgi:prepilin signal peptidase PulO-like enzyme (type II secretory pathway)